MPTAQEYLTKAYELIDAAELRGGAMTDGERREVEDLLAKARVDNIGRQLGAPGWSSFGGAAFSGGGPGDRFVASEGFRKISDPAGRGKQWSTGMVEVGPAPAFMTKGTLTEGVGSPGTGSGGGLIPVPQVAPGLVGMLFQPLTVEALMSSSVATTSTIRYCYQGTATSGAAGVGEAQLKPESSIGIATTDEPIRKIATTVTLSDEILEDVAAVQTFCNAELGRYVNIEVERQLLRGTASGNEVQGLLVGRGVPVFTASTADGNSGEQLFRAFNGVRGSAFTEPDLW